MRDSRYCQKVRRIHLIINIGLRFILELCALVAIGYWGFQLDKGILVKLLLGIVLPLVVIVVWGTFGSPGAPYPLTGIYRLLLEIAIMGGATVALFASGFTKLAVGFGSIVILNKILMYIWGQ